MALRDFSDKAMKRFDRKLREVNRNLMADKNTDQGKCPECETEITLDKGDAVGEYINCDDCGTELEITGLDPATFDIVSDEYDDEEDEYLD